MSEDTVPILMAHQDTLDELTEAVQQLEHKVATLGAALRNDNHQTATSRDGTDLKRP